MEEDDEKDYIHNLDIEEKINLGKISVEEIKAAIKTMANNKAGGLDRCNAEVMKFLDDSHLGEIADILSDYWRNAAVPDEMTKASLVCLYQTGNPRM